MGKQTKNKEWLTYFYSKQWQMPKLNSHRNQYLTLRISTWDFSRQLLDLELSLFLKEPHMLMNRMTFGNALMMSMELPMEFGKLSSIRSWMATWRMLDFSFQLQWP